MATVRISQELRADIMANARSGFGTRINQVVREANEILADVTLQEAIRDTVADACGMTRNEYDQLPDGLLTPYKEIRVQFINGVDVNRYANTIQMQGSPLKMPHSMTSAAGWSGYNLKSPHLEPFEAKLRHLGSKINAINEEADKFQDGVDKILTKCTTLKQALDVWPQLIDLVPDRFKARHYEKVERKKADDLREEIAVDVMALNVGAVKNKLAQAA